MVAVNHHERLLETVEDLAVLSVAGLHKALRLQWKKPAFEGCRLCACLRAPANAACHLKQSRHPVRWMAYGSKCAS